MCAVLQHHSVALATGQSDQFSSFPSNSQFSSVAREDAAPRGFSEGHRYEISVKTPAGHCSSEWWDNTEQSSSVSHARVFMDKPHGAAGLQQHRFCFTAALQSGAVWWFGLILTQKKCLISDLTGSIVSREQPAFAAPPQKDKLSG